MPSEEIKEKQCKCCKNTYLESSENFYICNGKFMSICKKCNGINNAKYAKENKEKISLRRKKYREENKESLSIARKELRKKYKEKELAYSKEYYKKNKEKVDLASKKYINDNIDKIREKRKKYRAENKEHIQRYAKEHSILYRNKNYEKIKNKKKEYHIKNKEKILEKVKQYAKTHRKQRNEYVSNRSKNDINFKLRNHIGNSIRMILKKYFVKKTDKTMNYLGCTIKELVKYLEDKFLPRMSWENHGQYGWHIDHIIPCAYFDLTKPEEQNKCFHYTNLQPLWAKDNLNKNSFYNGNIIRKKRVNKEKNICQA